MPLLSNRRSVLDLLNNNKDPSNAKNEQPQPKRPKPSALLRPHTARNADPLRPKSEHGSYPRSSLSHEVRPEDVESDDEVGGRAKRFSLLKLRNFSESQLSAKVREQGNVEDRPPMPALPASTASVPSIMRTAPTFQPGPNLDQEQHDAEESESERKGRPSLFKRSLSKSSRSGKVSPRKSMDEKRADKRKSTSLRWRRLQGRSTGLEDLQRMSQMQVQNNHTNGLAPPSYGDESNSALALPTSTHRFSESGGSEGSNASSDQIYGSTTTTTHTVTHTTFFKLPRRNKNRNSLFPLPVKLAPPGEDQPSLEGHTTPRASTGQIPTKSPVSTSNGPDSRGTVQRRHTESSPTKQGETTANFPAALAKSSLSFAEPGMNLFRNDSQRSRASSNTSPLHPPMRLGTRDRASTTSSLGRHSHDVGTPPPLTGSGRNSTSTTGRSSLGGFLNLSRFSKSSEPHSPRHGSPGATSKSNSFAMSREALVVPEREEGDSPGKYLERLEAAVAKSMIAGILSKSADPFAQAVLRSYTRRFPFFGEPIDMSLRKFLLEADLPKETQQVDRVIQAFSDRYHECNPGVFVNSDQAYIIAFSLMMLHTDAFNKNNKRKMQKHDYIRNTSGQDVSDEVLACFYDNICYTPFVHYEEEVDINGERVLPFKPKKSKLKGAITESGKKPSGPVDPYNLLVEQKLEQLRPPIRDAVTMEDHYNYRAPGQGELDPNYLQRAFTHTGVLQIISQRSRPTAYEGQLTNMPAPNPQDMQVGIIDIKITKVGTLWRKAAKKKKARSPWQEWGAILTGSQLYLFKNAHWAKGLVNQFMAAQKHGQPRTPVIFKPPLQEFKPDALIKTDNAVALVDASYNRHKHAFTFVRPGGQEEVLLADNESELHDWLALINYAAAFRAAGVRIRGMVGGAEEDLRAKDVQRLESTNSTQSAHTVQTSDGGEINLQNRGLTPQLHRQVMAARRQIMIQKIGEGKKQIEETKKELDKMLRNARHILVLAPIPPRTREDVMHAAAHADAMIKWTRRDIWRLQCHKDILAMDVRQDGVSASEVELLADQKATEPPAPESAKKTRTRGLSRLNSKASARRSPPQSPTSPARAGRPSITSSRESHQVNDVFRTPPESTHVRPIELDGFRIPQLQLDVLRQEAREKKQSQEEPRGSVASASSGGLLVPSSPGRASLSHASSASSVRRGHMERLHSVVSGTTDASEGASAASPPSASEIDDRELELMARATIGPDQLSPIASRNPAAIDTTATPESSKQRSGVRRSLQKTLRDAHNHRSSSVHRHRKGKDSDGTIRSEGEEKEREREDVVLKREKGAFMLHGKKASVVHFGSEWPSERMRVRREQWREGSAGSSGIDGAGGGGGTGGVGDQERTPRQASWTSAGQRQRGAGSPVVLDFPGEGSGTEEDEREDPRAARPADAMAVSPMSFSPDLLIPQENSTTATAGGYFDPSFTPSSATRKPKRETVIGPRTASPSERILSQQQSFSAERKQSLASEMSSAPSPTSRPRKVNRDTVIGPRQQQKPRQESTASTSSSLGSIFESGAKARKLNRDTIIGPSSSSAAAGRPGTGGRSDNEDSDDEEAVDDEVESLATRPVSHEEMRRYSQVSASASPVSRGVRVR